METTEEMSNPLECLPIEVVAMIAQYLSVKDLGSCCATSCGMRELFNDDIVWKPRCTKELAEYLRTTPCKVEPAFVSPEVQNSTLSPISLWRMAFMYENHLWNNWRQGRFKKEEIKNKNSENSRNFCIWHTFHTNDCVLAVYEGKIELLDVRGYPAVNATETIITSVSYDGKVISGNNMITTVYKSGVHVYHIDLNTRQSSLKHVFFFEESQKMDLNEPENIKKLFDARKKQPHFLPVGKYVIMGHFFVGVLEGESTMHIWDLESGLKLKEETCPLKHSTIVEAKASQSLDVVLAIKQRGQNKGTFIAYSLTKLSYLPFTETMESGDQHFVKNDTVGIWGNDHLDIYNYKKSKVLLKDCPAQSYPQFYMNNFVFIQNNSLKMFNPSTEVLESLPLDDINWFELISNRFVQVKRNGNFEIWEIEGTWKKLKKTSMKLWFYSCGFFLNKASSRYIVREGVGHVLNFW